MIATGRATGVGLWRRNNILRAAFAASEIMDFTICWKPGYSAVQCAADTMRIYFLLAP